MKNLLAIALPTHRTELFEELFRGREFRAERIVSNGHVTPPNEWYDQSADEWVVLLTGAARLQFDQPEQVFEMRPGDFINIPAHQRHRVEWTDPNNPTVWLAIHYQPREQDEAFNEETS